MPILRPINRLKQWWHALQQPPHLPLTLCDQQLPNPVRRDAVAIRYHRLLHPINWAAFPERDLEADYPQAATPYAPFAAACLVKLVVVPVVEFVFQFPVGIWESRDINAQTKNGSLVVFQFPVGIWESRDAVEKAKASPEPEFQFPVGIWESRDMPLWEALLTAKKCFSSP